MTDLERLKEWVRVRREYWRQNRSDDPQNCWIRMNEDTSFLAAIERLEAENDETGSNRNPGVYQRIG